MGYDTLSTASPVPPGQRRDLASALVPLAEVDRQDFVVFDDGYRRLLARLGKKLYNGLTYVFDRLVSREPLRIACSLGYYYDALSTCDVLEWELLLALADAGAAPDFSAIAAKLRPRNTYRSSGVNPIADGAGRSAAMSISTLVVFNTGETYKALLRPRSGDTAAHSDLYHVVPSFIFQPTTWDERGEYDIQHNVFREYLEELFDVHEVQVADGQIAPDWFYSHPRLLALRALLDGGAAELLLTGFAVNMLNLRPEICTLLLIRDPDWQRQPVAANWEFLKFSDQHERRMRVLVPVDVLQPDAAIARYLSSIAGTFVPPGAAAFWLGVDVARELVRA